MIYCIQICIIFYFGERIISVPVRKDLKHNMELPLQEIELAAKRLASTVHKTKLERSTTFSEMTGGEIYLKYENQQKTGSFKIRGASNKIVRCASAVR